MLIVRFRYTFLHFRFFAIAILWTLQANFHRRRDILYIKSKRDNIAAARRIM